MDGGALYRRISNIVGVGYSQAEGIVSNIY